jgi:hypothetical protein
MKFPFLLSAFLVTFGCVAAPLMEFPAKTPAEEFARIDARCKTDEACQLRELFAKAQILFNGSQASASLAMRNLDRVTKSQIREHIGRAIADARARALPLLDHAVAKNVPSSSKTAIDEYRSQMARCIEAMLATAGEDGEHYSTRGSSCESKLARLRDQALATLGVAPLSKHFGFRDSKWGDTPEQVEAKEGSPGRKIGSEIQYDTTIASRNAVAMFRFADGHLAAGGYVFDEQHNDPNYFVDDYVAVNDLLKLKYGKPVINDETWADDSLKQDRSMWGAAIAAGHLGLTTMWSLDGTDITHRVTRNESGAGISHVLGYESAEYKPALDLQKETVASHGL